MRDAIRRCAELHQPRGVHFSAGRRRRHAGRRDDRTRGQPASRCGSCSTRSAARGLAGLQRRLRDAGCQLNFYQPIRWYRLHRLNNRTHRELLVVDGRVAFTGGAGVADWWLKPTSPSLTARLGDALGLIRAHKSEAAWRDTMARIEGPIVTALQGVFAENWLECCGEILTSPRHWPTLAPAGSGRSDAREELSRRSRDRLARRVSDADRRRRHAHRHQHAIPSSRTARSDARSLRAAARGVRVRIIVPGSVTDQRLVRLASRRMYRRAARSRRPHSRVPAGHDARRRCCSSTTHGR